MDPPTATLMNVNQTTSSYNLTEIWPLPINGFDRFAEPGSGREGSGNEPGSRRKRGDTTVDDDSAPMSDSDNKRLKSSGSGDENQTQKVDGEVNSRNSRKRAGQKSKAPPDPQQDYIHVRARRGQATDSHSLAERARREKISERMRILQDLVPGCNKVIGKALVLDEIINYIQSLQRQVEFLSMKLEAVNARVSPGIEGFPSKDFGQQAFDTPGVGYCSQLPREYGRSTSPDWLHMQIGGGFERQT